MFKNGKDLPENNHVIRRIGMAKVFHDENGYPTGEISPQAFDMRPLDGDRLSVNWLEYYNSDMEGNLSALKGCLSTKPNRIGKNSFFAMGIVEKIKSVCRDEGFNSVRVVYQKNNEDNPSHSVIRNLPVNHLILQNRFRNEAFTELIPVASLP